MTIKNKPKPAKVALITGGSSGLGFELANILGNEGYSLIILARNKEKLNKAVSDLQNKGHNTKGFQCDISKEEQIKKVFNKVKNEFQKIDFLVLNAGVVSCKLLVDFKNPNELRHDLEINLWGTILSTYIFLPLLIRSGKILMISSAFGLMGVAAYTIYSASKAGIITFGESLRRELLCKKIAVYVACPGDIKTPQLHNERKNMPIWFKNSDPRKMLHPKVAAKRILKKCSGKNFLITISAEITSLAKLGKLTTKKIREKCLDKIFPMPNEKDYQIKT